MSLRPHTRLSKITVERDIPSNPASNNPLRVSSANRFDKLLLTAACQRVFTHSTAKKRDFTTSPMKREASLGRVKPSPVFISQSRDSPVPNSLNHFFLNKSPKLSFIQEKTEISEINFRMQRLKNDCERELSNLDRVLTADKRIATFRALKNIQEEYQGLKNSRSAIIKKQRILQNAYPEGLESDKSGSKGEIYVSNPVRVQNLAKIFRSDELIKDESLKRNLSEKRVYSDSPIVAPENFVAVQSRVKKLAQFSLQPRPHNIITGALY